MVCPLLSVNSENPVECVGKDCMWFMQDPDDIIKNVCAIKFFAIKSGVENTK